MQNTYNGVVALKTSFVDSKNCTSTQIDRFSTTSVQLSTTAGYVLSASSLVGIIFAIIIILIIFVVSTLFYFQRRLLAKCLKRNKPTVTSPESSLCSNNELPDLKFADKKFSLGARKIKNSLATSTKKIATIFLSSFDPVTNTNNAQNDFENEFEANETVVENKFFKMTENILYDGYQIPATCSNPKLKPQSNCGSLKKDEALCKNFPEPTKADAADSLYDRLSR